MLCRCGRYHIHQKQMRDNLMLACTSWKNQCYSGYRRHVIYGFMIDNGYLTPLRLDLSFFTLTIVFPKEFMIMLMIRYGTGGLHEP